MPQVIPENELQEIIRVIDDHGGMRVETIRERLSFTLPTRTLQRRLKMLKDAERIRVTGSGKGTLYFPLKIATHDSREGPLFYKPMTPVTQEPSPVLVAEDPADFLAIPLSPAALEIQRHIRGPLTSRTPVGYNPEFLETYVPNETFYLPENTREELAKIGRVGASSLPAGTYIRQVLERLLIDLSWNSSRLEGNTYSLLETAKLLELGEGTDGRGADETQMLLNHKAAIDMLAEQADEIGFNRYTICNLHAILSDNLLPDFRASGRVRSRAVGIGGSAFLPLEAPQRIDRYFDVILAKAEAVKDPFEQAFFVMVHLPYLQPFEDVNKRVSRLAANIPLVKHNLCPLSFIDLPQSAYISGLLGVYELNRIEHLREVFIWAYKRSAGSYSAVLQTLGEPDPFRLHHRTQIGECVRAVVQAKLDKGAAARWIAEYATNHITQPAGHRFIEVVETELSCLHEGNIARYRLRPNEFEQWQQTW